MRDVFALTGLSTFYARTLRWSRSLSRFPFHRHTNCRNNTNKATIVKSQPSKSQSQSHFGSSNSTQKHDDISKGVYIESFRSIQHNQCFRCQGFGAAQNQSKTRTLIIETQSGGDHDDLEKIIPDIKRDVWEDKLVVDQVASLGCLLSIHSPSIDEVNGIIRRLSVVRRTLAKLKESDD